MRSLVVAAILWSTAAQAAPAANEEVARAHYIAGREHYENGRYEAAVTEFEASYAALPKPELRYNLYLSYERLGQFDRALAQLEAYLNEGKIEPAERERLIARRDALRQRAATPAATSSTTSAPPPTPPEAVYGPAPQPAENRGLFFGRLGLGVGYASADTDAYTISGGMGGLQLALGVNLTDRLALHATLWGASMVEPSVKIKEGILRGLVISTDNVKYTSAAVGLGVTWRFPYRFHISGSIGAASVTAEEGSDKKTESDPGPALLLSGGKEWRLGGSWNAGFAVSLTLQSIPEKIDMAVGDQQKDNNVTVFMLGVMGTVAYD